MLRVLAVHTVPLWEEPNGMRRLGMEVEVPHPPVVGWCNVAVVEVQGVRVRLLLV